MPNETTNYQCPACTGPLRFDSATGKLVCDYCGSTYEVKEVEALYADKQKASDTAARQRPQGPVWGEEEAAGLTSRTCSSCGSVSGPQGVNGLRIREWTCVDCGAIHDRDRNAAANILRLGLDDPKYAPVTHWRLAAAAPEAKP